MTYYKIVYTKRMENFKKISRILQEYFKNIYKISFWFFFTFKKKKNISLYFSFFLTKLVGYIEVMIFLGAHKIFISFSIMSGPSFKKKRPLSFFFYIDV